MDSEYQPLNEDAKRALRTCLPVLQEKMQTDELMTWMESENAFTYVDIQNIEAKSKQYEKNKEFITLLIAKSQKTFETYIQSLWETGQRHLSSQVLDKLMDRAYANKLLRSCQAQRQPIITTPEGDIEKIQAALKEMYFQRFKKINPFSLPFTFDIENTWVSLALRGAGKKSQATEDHAELLKSAFEKEKMLIIEGKPATGKTSLMRRLAYEWAKGERKLSQYELVLYAEFREVRESVFEKISDLVMEYNNNYCDFFDNTELEDLKHLVNNKVYCKQKSILILLDGYDESSLDKQCKELREYVTATTLKSPLFFNIVVTTRPGYLGQHRGKQGKYIFADVLGFTTIEQKDKYIFNHFNSLDIDGEENIVAVRQVLQRNDNINKLAETPLFLTFICLVHEKIVDGTVLELYCNTVWWLIDRHQKDFPHRDIPLLFEFPHGTSDKFKTIQNNYLQFPQLLNLGKMAFNNLKNDVYQESDCVQFNLKEIIRRVGLLRTDEFHDESFHITTTFSLPHRTIQEFLAAIYCFCSHEQLDHGFKSELKTKGMTEYEKFLLRIALSDKISINKETRKHYFNAIKDLGLDQSCDALQIPIGINSNLLKTFLSQCTNMRSLMIENCTFVVNSPLSFTNCSAWKCLSLQKCKIQIGCNIKFRTLTVIDELEFDDCTIDLEAWQSITEEIRYSSAKSLKLSFKGEDFNNDYANQLQKCNNVIVKMNIKKSTIGSNGLFFNNLISLHTLTLSGCSFEVDSHLSFKDCSSLKNLYFKACEIKSGAALGITQITAIDTLEFDKCTINLEAWQSITEEMRSSSLKFLKLSFNEKDFNNDYITHLQICNNIFVNMTVNESTLRSKEIFSFNNFISLHSLTFSNCTFEVDSQLSFIDCSSLKNMHFEECDIKRGAALNIAQLNAIDALEFQNCIIDSDIWQSIIEEMRNSSLKFLELSFNEKDFNNEYITQLQKCNNIIVHLTIHDSTIGSNELFSFNNLLNLQSLTFRTCSFEEDSHLSFKHCRSLKNLHFEECEIKRGAALGITQITAIESLKFNNCTIDIETWKLITKEIKKCTVKNLQLSFQEEEFKNEYINQLQKCSNVIIEQEINSYTLRSTELFSFNNLINLHSLIFYNCSFEAGAQLPFKDCITLKNLEFSLCKIKRGAGLNIAQLNAIDALEFFNCTIDMEAWELITEEIKNSSVKGLKIWLKGEDFNNDYVTKLQECNTIIIHMIINEFTLRSNEIFYFNNLISLHTLTFFKCTFEADSQLSFIDCPSLKNLHFWQCNIQRDAALSIPQLNAINALEFHDCIVDLEVWQSIVEEIRNSSLKFLELSFNEEDFNNDYVTQLQNCNNIIISLAINESTIRLNESFCNNVIELHSFIFKKCYFLSYSQSFFKNLPVINTLEFYSCNIDLETWQLIVEEINNSPIKCLKFTPDCSKYLESVEKCYMVEEIYVVNSFYEGDRRDEPSLYGSRTSFEDYENDIVQILIQLAQNMQNLKRIVFDFTEEEGSLKESNKELIENAGQERDPTLAVSVLSYKPWYKR